MHSSKKILLPLIATVLLYQSPTVQAITTDQLAQQFEVYKAQQAKELAEIRSENAQLKAENKELKQQFEQTKQQVTNNAMAVDTVAENYETGSGKSGWWEKTTIGGYGELHYNNHLTESSPRKRKHEIDFHRFVLFFGHQFTDKLRFFSELELEHSIAGDGKVGEIELEQAYIEYDITDWASAKAGLFLMPVGILNETHEPATFYGVERNQVEKHIIPTTWWEGGIAANVHFGNGISADIALTSGLKLDESYSIRSGRGKVGKQDASDPAIAARIKYTGIPGLELASTIIHQPDMEQRVNGVPIGGGTLYEIHVIYSHNMGPGTFSGRALYSQWDLDINDPAAHDAENQYGWYLEPSYRLPTSMGDVGVYTRFEQLEYYKNELKKSNIWSAGANWWIHENVVLKGTYFYEDKRDGSANTRGFDLGIGYQF
jgi:hypothetical protein